MRLSLYVMLVLELARFRRAAGLGGAARTGFRLAPGRGAFRLRSAESDVAIPSSAVSFSPKPPLSAVLSSPPTQLSLGLSKDTCCPEQVSLHHELTNWRKSTAAVYVIRTKKGDESVPARSRTEWQKCSCCDDTCMSVHSPHTR